MGITSVHSSEISSPIYVLKQSGTVENVIFYDNGKIKTNALDTGKTYSEGKCQLDYNTKSNSSVILAISDDVVVSLDESSEFKLHTFSVELGNGDSLPAKAKLSNKNIVATLMSGMVDVVNSSTNGQPVLLQTPRVTVVVGKGKTRVLVQGKTTIIAVIEGSSTLNKVVEGNKFVVPAGSFAHVTTYYSLSNKGIDLHNNGRPTATLKVISEEDLKRTGQNFSDMMSLSSGVMFSVIDKSVIGVKID